MTAPAGFTRFATPPAEEDPLRFVLDTIGPAYLDGRRWFFCPGCRGFFIGGLREVQTTVEEGHAAVAHKRVCDLVTTGGTVKSTTTPPPNWQPFNDVQGLTDDDRRWLFLQLAAAGLDPVIADRPAPAPTAVPAKKRPKLRRRRNWVAVRPPAWMLAGVGLALLVTVSAVYRLVWWLSAVVADLVGLPPLSVFAAVCGWAVWKAAYPDCSRRNR